MSDITPKQVPFGQYEYVNVTFGPANQDVLVPYERLRVETATDVMFLDTQPAGLSNGTPVYVYRLVQSAASAWGANFIILRCTVANYSTRLLLYTERV